MHRFRGSLALALLLVVLPTWFAPASAGGPTSALLSVPGQGRTASLYYTDPQYDALSDLVGISGAAGKVDDSGRTHDNGGPGVTITWLIHDVDPWRIDRVYPDGAGSAWIATQETNGTGSIWDSPVVWHQPADGAALVSLLDELGVGRAAREATSFDGVAGQPAPPAEQPVTTTAPTTTEPAADGSSGIAGAWWALGGLVVGALAVLAGTRLRRREGSGPDAWQASDPDSAATDELTWPASRA